LKLGDPMEKKKKEEKTRQMKGGFASGEGPLRNGETAPEGRGIQTLTKGNSGLLPLAEKLL